MTDFRVTEWSLEGVLDHMARTHNVMKDRQFAFILGAGASFTSGIPTGQHLAQQWLKDLHLRECWDGRTFEQWLPECGIGNGNITLETAAEYYPLIFERRFDGDREAGYAELEAAMERKSPSLGYSLLAEIIQNTRHKVVVTTNFDNLVADALAMHAHQSPLVVAHESLTGFVRPQMRRPLVAKIHRDLYLHPLNDQTGVSTMEQGWKIALKKLFQYFTPVVVGYGGNDGSLMDMLWGLEEGDIAGRMIWCFREGSPPPEKAMKVLEKHRGLLVKISGFDQFMLQLADKLLPDFDVGAIAERIAEQGSERADRYRDQASKFSVQAVRGSPAEQRAGEVLKQSLRSGQNWSAWQIRANSEPDRDKRNEIFLEGIRLFPTSAQLAGNYANFLQDSGNYDAAEAMYKTALKLNPDNITHTNNYAIFLANQRKDYDSAELLYKKALEIAPNDVRATRNYALFLSEQREDYDAAEKMYRKALELEPNSPMINGNFGHFLHTRMGDIDAAEYYYKKAIDLDPTDTRALSNYANLLADEREDYDTAENMYRKVLELDPKDDDNIGNFANFLEDQRENFEAAEKMYKKALKLNPKNANIIANYANFLEIRKEDYITAEKMYLKARELEPNHKRNNANYAIFLDRGIPH